MKGLDSFDLGGKFVFTHIRDGKVIGQDESTNKFVDEGLIYALNSAFTGSLAGNPAIFANIYIGLSTEDRTWVSSDAATSIHAVSTEFEDYDEVTRPEWVPVALASSGSILLSSVGAEATFTISTGIDDNVYGAFLITANAKAGTSDATATLIAGSNFSPSFRNLKAGDIFKVGYILSAASST